MDDIISTATSWAPYVAAVVAIVAVSVGIRVSEKGGGLLKRFISRV